MLAAAPPWPAGGLALADHEVNDARHIAPALDIAVGHEAGRVLRRAVLTQGNQQRATAQASAGVTVAT